MYPKRLFGAGFLGDIFKLEVVTVWTVREIMSDHAVTVSPATLVSAAIETLLDEGVSVLLVVDPPHRVVGTLPESALLGAALDPQMSLDPVSLYMTRQFVSIGPQATLEMVVDQFILHCVGHLPVVEGDRLLGVVSRRDVLKAVFGATRRGRSVAATLG